MIAFWRVFRNICFQVGILNIKNHQKSLRNIRKIIGRKRGNINIEGILRNKLRKKMIYHNHSEDCEDKRFSDEQDE